MSFYISCQKQCSGSVTCGITCCCKSIIQCKNSEHQRHTGISEFQDSGQGSQGYHYGSPWKSGCANGTGGKQNTEDQHSSRCRNRAVQNTGDHHSEEYLCKHRTTVMNLGKKRNCLFDKLGIKRHTFVSCFL